MKSFTSRAVRTSALAGHKLGAMCRRHTLVAVLRVGRVGVGRQSPIGAISVASVSPASAPRMLRVVHARSTAHHEEDDGGREGASRRATFSVMQITGAAAVMMWAGSAARRSSACDCAAAAHRPQPVDALRNVLDTQQPADAACRHTVATEIETRWPGIGLVLLRLIRHVARGLLPSSFE